jgi:cell division transport system permease protein
MLIATMLSVTFATRGAMSTNRPIVEVLHVVGAKDAYIAGEFQRHFLFLGLKGGAAGGAAAVAFFFVAGLLTDWFAGTAQEGQVASLFGNFAIGPAGYGGLFGIVVLVAAVTAGTSRFTVYRTLRSLD